MADVVKEALAGYGEGHDRKPVGDINNVIGNTTPPVERGTLRPKGGATADSDPAFKGYKSPTTAERLGAKYRIEVPMLQANAPEAQLTQANGIVIKSVIGNRDNFDGGSSDTYAGR